MASYSSVLAWRIPGTGAPWWTAIYGVAQSDMTEVIYQQRLAESHRM